MSASRARRSRGLADTIAVLRQQISSEDQVRVRGVLDAFEGRAFGPILAIIGLIVVTPIGAIPLVPTLMGSLLFLIAIQRLFGRTYPWIPKRLRDRSVEQRRLDNVLKAAEPWARRIDRMIKPRLTFMFNDAMGYVLAAIVVGLALSMPPLEVVPFAAAIPAGATLLFGLALTAQDGLLALLGIAGATATAGVLIAGVV